MPFKRSESAFKRTLIFEKTAIRYPVFGVFWLPPNLKTLINSHFQILNILKFNQKSAILWCDSIARAKIMRIQSIAWHSASETLIL